MKAIAIDLAALGDTDPLWHDWLDEAGRRFRVDVNSLEEELPNWRQLLHRFAEDRAPIYLRRDADVVSALRRLQAAGARIGVFTNIPEELAQIALSHLGAERRVEALETGDGARERLLERLGTEVTVVSSREELLAVT